MPPTVRRTVSRGEEPGTTPGVEDMKAVGEFETRQGPRMVAGGERVLNKPREGRRARKRRVPRYEPPGEPHRDGGQDDG